MQGNGILGRRARIGMRRGLVGPAFMVILALAGAGPTAHGADAPSASGPPASPAASGAIGPNVRHIDLTTTSMLQILDDSGQPIPALVVRPGETLEIRVNNAARFAHNLHVGPHDALAADQTDGLPGVPSFTGGSRTFTWLVPDSVDGLWYGCTVVGHFALMQGPVIALADTMPDVAGLPEADAVAILRASGLLTIERTDVPDPSAEPGTILAQLPAPGSPVELDTVVRYTVAAGPAASPG